MMGKQATYPILLNGLKVQKAFQGRGVPNTFIIDQQGKVRYKHRGFSDGMKKFIEMEIQSLLDETGAKLIPAL
jgi:lipid II:glycine glycyltransferase (peptidoglycan interpeptide bridge formation enzyme)